MRSLAGHSPKRKQRDNTMNDLTIKKNNAVTAVGTVAENIGTAANEDAGLGKLLKFKKGLWEISGQRAAADGTYIVHAVAWSKSWIKFEDRKVAERHVYSVARNEKPAERKSLGDLDETKWPIGLDGKPSDPWSLQYLLPLEDTDSGDICVFTTSSVGGKRAVGDVCKAWAQHGRKDRSLPLPIVKLGVGEMMSAKFGRIVTPKFEIVGWDEHGNGDVVATANTTSAADSIEPDTAKAAFDDEIPF